jgi:hypothetical protein
MTAAQREGADRAAATTSARKGASVLSQLLELKLIVLYDRRL